MELEREDILARLRPGLPALKRQFPLHGLSLFGSVVRGEAFAESDIDVIADVDPSIGLDFVTLADKLEELTGQKIDLISRRAIKPAEFKNRHSAIPWTQIAVLRNRTDKGTMGKGIDPKEGATHSSRVGLQNLPHVPSTK